MYLPSVLSLLLLLGSSVAAAPAAIHKRDAPQVPSHVHSHVAKQRNRFVQEAVNGGWVIQDQSDRYHPGVQVVMSGHEKAGQVFGKGKDGMGPNKDVKKVEKKKEKEQMSKDWIHVEKHDTVPVVMPGSEKAKEVFKMRKGGATVKKTSKDGKERSKQRMESINQEWSEQRKKMMVQQGEMGNRQP